MKNYKAILSVVLTSVLSFGALLGCGTSEQAATDGQKQSVKIGWQPSMEAQFYVAQAEKLFEKNGMEPEYTKFTAGPPMFAALNNGSIDVSYMGGPPAIISMAENIPVSVIAVEVEASEGEGLVVTSQSGIEKLEDVKGKKISVLRGSSAEFGMMSGLKKAGLAEGDLQTLDLDVTTIVPAFQKGDVDGVWVWEPWMSKLVSAGGKVIATDGDVGVNMAGVWMARNDWIEKNPEAVELFLKSLTDANQFIQKDKSAAAKIMQNALALEPQEAENIINAVTFPTLQELWDPNGTFSMNPSAVDGGKGLVKALTDLATFLQEKGKISQVPDFKQHINSTFVEKLAQ